MNSFMRSASFALGASLVCSTAFAQSAISVRSGMVHYSEGSVTIGHELLDQKFGHFPDLKEGQVLTTTEGRAEILLTPGVFLRVAENSSVKMISSRLIDTRVELLAGTILVESAELQMPKDNAVTFIYKDTTVEIHKKTLIRLDASEDKLRTYDGEVTVTKAGETMTLKEGKQTLLAGVLSPEKFDTKVGDSFYRWASRRAGTLAVANLAAAKTLHDNDTRWLSGGWMFNPMLGSATYIPGRGYYSSPFGFNFYSPMYVNRIYDNVLQVNNGAGYGQNNGFSGGMTSPQVNPNLGYETMSRGGQSQSSAPSYSGPGNAAAPAPAPAAAQSGDRGGTQNSGGRGR